MLRSINLALSSLCGADCIYCPSNRGKRIKQKFMAFETASKIIDEISSENFKSKHKISRIEVGENGDAFLNKDIFEILRYIRFKLPEMKVEVFTNFHHLTKDKARLILAENLINRFHCNIDGSNEANYFAVKGIDFNVVKQNISDFLEVREILNNISPLTIHILTLNNYIRTIHRYFAFYPMKLKDKGLITTPDDCAVIEEQWGKLVNKNKKDVILKTSYMYSWAEREKCSCESIDYKNYSCPNLWRVKNEAFIAPDGTWYACCYDANFELALGNVMIESMDIIYSSQIRRNLLEKLEKREFNEIKGPCRTVNCCQLNSSA